MSKNGPPNLPNHFERARASFLAVLTLLFFFDILEFCFWLRKEQFPHLIKGHIESVRYSKSGLQQGSENRTFKFGFIRKPDVFDVWILNGKNTKWLPKTTSLDHFLKKFFFYKYKMVQIKKCPVFEWSSFRMACRPFEIRTRLVFRSPLYCNDGQNKQCKLFWDLKSGSSTIWNSRQMVTICQIK